MERAVVKAAVLDERLDWISRIPRFRDHLLYYLKAEYWSFDSGSAERIVMPKPTKNLDDANLISSELAPITVSTCDNAECSHHQKTVKGMHSVMLDIDKKCLLVPSSTSGHFHLYVDTVMPWRKYKRLLRALARADLIEPGYYKASVARKGTHLRLPWVKKDVIH